MTIDEYDALERKARCTACYPAIRAFAPTTFHNVGFPTRVYNDEEIARYADIMTETVPRGALMKTLYSELEAGAMRTVSAHVFAASGITPLASLLNPISMWRGIEKIAKGRELFVMDVGAGAGYLCAYLALAGHEVWAVETTQALYLWQSWFFGNYPTIRQVPWWVYAELYREENLPVFDAIICDAALGEMDSWAMRYTLALAKQIGCPVLYRSIGEPRLHNESEINGYALSIGVELIKIVDPPPLGPAVVKAEAIVDHTHRCRSYDFMDFIGIGK